MAAPRTFESRTLFDKLVSIGGPLQMSVPSPSRGLSGELSLSYGITKLSQDNIIHRNQHRTFIQMTTTGKAISWGAKAIRNSITSQVDFGLSVWWINNVPDMNQNMEALIIISYMPDNSQHPFPFWDWVDASSQPELRRFGIWMQLITGGVWLQMRPSRCGNQSLEAQRAKFERVPAFISEALDLLEHTPE